MNYIKDIFSGKTGQEYIHQRFIRYSKGSFDAAVIELKKAGDKLKIKGSHEYAEIMAYVLAKASTGKIKVSGTIASKEDIKTTIPLQKGKKKLGVLYSEIKTELDAKELVSLLEENPRIHILIDVDSPAGKLKTKKKPPRPGGEIDSEFFSAEINPGSVSMVLDEICFDFQNKDFSEAKIKHTYNITELVIPEEYRKDAAKARIYAKRKGTITRSIEVDGIKTENKKEFIV